MRQFSKRKNNNTFKIGIVGHGFVGQAVEYAFTHPLVEFQLFDPKYNTSVDDLEDVTPEDAPHWTSSFLHRHHQTMTDQSTHRS